MKMTPSELKYQVEQKGGYFFTRSTMKFFGDTMANYGVRSKPVEVVNCMGETFTCWELYRRRPVKMNAQYSAYFDVNTFERVLPKVGE